jgi:hypothetical protein
MIFFSTKFSTAKKGKMGISYSYKNNIVKRDTIIDYKKLYTQTENAIC